MAQEMPPSKGSIEQLWLEQGSIVAGLDEVGRGCLAGPVVAACAVLDYTKLAMLDESSKSRIRDSKTLSGKQRSEVLSLIESILLDSAIGLATEREIESLGIQSATFLAMNRAVAGLVNVAPTFLLVDGNQIIKSQKIKQQAVIKGDSLCYCIAAASIIAKEFRDRLMREQSKRHTKWSFEKHVGYGTAEHLSAIETHGICDLHRRNFAPIKFMQLS